MGIRIGSQFEPSTIQVLRGLILPVVGTTVLLLSGSWLLAYWLTQRLNLDGTSAYLAATPGGLDSVAAVATELHSNSGVILMIHFARLFSVLLVGPWLVRGGASVLQRSVVKRASKEAKKVIVQDE
jgi:membrane AbrB-like protein